MTGCWVSGANSVLFASDKPQTLRAYSIVAQCIPRQIPKKGILFSRAKRIAKGPVPEIRMFPRISALAPRYFTAAWIRKRVDRTVAIPATQYTPKKNGPTIEMSKAMEPATDVVTSEMFASTLA